MTTPDAREHETMDQTLIRRIVEAALLASPQPLTLAQLVGLFPDDEQPPKDSLELAIESLREGCADRGVELVEVASGFRFQVKADVHAWVARLWTERQTKYTRATLETLALIAYRQPITRGEIEQIRGVSVNANMIKMLEEREWIRSVGHRDVPGRPELFGTTKTFLDVLRPQDAWTEPARRYGRTQGPSPSSSRSCPSTSRRPASASRRPWPANLDDEIGGRRPCRRRR